MKRSRSCPRSDMSPHDAAAPGMQRRDGDHAEWSPNQTSFARSTRDKDRSTGGPCGHSRLLGLRR